MRADGTATHVDVPLIEEGSGILSSSFSPTWEMTREIITPAEAIQAIRNAGGFPVLAHPCLYRLGWMQTEELVRNLKELGLGGMECWHSSNYAEESSKLCRMADRYSLLPTGGSDFHGAAKPDIRIGSGRGNLQVPAEYLDALKLAMFLGQ